jgi:pyridoxal phosphate enzyme (YggS family)
MSDASEQGDRAFAERLADVRGRIARAAERSGRPASAVRLVAATKSVPATVLGTAVALGLRELGENRVQEAAAKIPAVAPRPAAWHLIGPLQSNKARKAAALFDCVQTLESLRLAEALDRVLGELDRPLPLPVFVEVNVSGEAAKHGVAPGAAVELVTAIRARCPRLEPVGLMTVGPRVDDPDAARPAYRALARLADEAGLAGRSMGMSGDFEVAIEEGATLVRVGSALFGARRSTAAP